jgi:pyridoxal/pyridoxine/pyridoxamine kinase
MTGYSLVLEIGYIGNYAILEKIEKMVQKLKAKNPNLIYGKRLIVY